MAAYFRQVSEGVFAGNDPARGPWDPGHCHAGPVTGLIARAAEDLAGPGRMLTRLTVDFLRPLPISELRVGAEIARQSRSLTTARVELRGPDGALCASATTMHLALAELGSVPSAPVVPLALEEAVPGRFPIRIGRHDRPMFADFVEVRLPPGQTAGPGPTTLWMRVPALIEGEAPSPVQSLCPLADCGNAIGRNAELDAFSFLNADLTLQVHRAPVSDWLAAQVVCHWHDTGIGVSHSVLSDTRGPVAVALQTLILRPVAAG